MAIRNWGEFPLDVAIEIADKIEFFEDVEAFAGVCTCWRRAAKLAERSSSSRQKPWLMLAEPPRTSYRRFYSLYNSKVRQVDLAAPSTTRHRTALGSSSLLFPPKEYKKESVWRYFSSCGWLICVTQIGLDIILMHPLSGQKIQTPALPVTILQTKVNLKWHDRLYLHIFHKFALSESPSTTRDYTMAMIISSTLAFWGSGNDNWWTTPNESYQTEFKDVIFYKGEFYAIRFAGDIRHVQVVACGNTSPCTPRLVVELGCYEDSYSDKFYLVESVGMLLLVSRKVAKSFNKHEQEYAYKTASFKVWEVNVIDGILTQVNSLGNRALFVGFTSSFSVESSFGKFWNKYYDMADCIYYTDDLLELYYLSEGGHDIGVYNLISGKNTTDHYQGFSRFSVVTPPLWVETPRLFTASTV
ncbi:uncharacterized protein LOC110692540 [Chenopodium quinoa]|uniref:uncharacterized protein LOC110692540 n=1 Tax=Chenopodium quinoa TaxID=63459 RepID=UPI000B78CDE6|nr:uncharacterized protein LOC110692540 [Chenopodium quinoa]